MLAYTPPHTHTQTNTNLSPHIHINSDCFFYSVGVRADLHAPIYTTDAAGSYVAQVGSIPHQASHIPHTHTKHTHTHTPVRHCKKSIFVPAVLRPGPAAQSVEAKQGCMHQAGPQLQLQHGGSGWWAADWGLYMRSQVKR